MSLQPLEDRIVVRPGQSEETTASGLVIPDTAKEKPQQGEVLAVGPGRRSEQSLYDFNLATYDEGDTFDQSLAKGFVNLWGLPSKIAAKRDQKG